MPNDGVGSSEIVACQKQSIPDPVERVSPKDEKAISGDIAFLTKARLEWPHVFSLPAFGALGHVELHGLALPQALETSHLDCREMHKNIFPTLTANEAVAFG